MSLTLITPPVQSPLSLQEAKGHLRVDGTDEDVLISSQIEAVRLHVEGRGGWLGRALITQTWEWRLDRFPVGPQPMLKVPLPPLQSVSQIQYIDTAGVLQTWSSALYTVDVNSEPARIAPVFGEVFPQTQSVIDAVTVTMVAGYGDAPANVPEPIRSALLLLIGDLYKNREAKLRQGQIDNPTVSALLMPHRIWGFG